MQAIQYRWESEGTAHSLDLVPVGGTGGEPYLFGEGEERRPIEVPDFYIATTPTTQSLWTHVMGAGSNPSCARGDDRPVENVSWDDLTRPGGFLERINAGEIRAAVVGQLPARAPVAFRLPSESEWEYAARGGPHWRDEHPFSGGDDIEAVAWYKDDSGDAMHPVARKAPNRLGLYDMSGNAWEWCRDSFTRDIGQIPPDGSPFTGEDERRVLRGGCFHNRAAHCTVHKRYELGRMYGDGCIGFRLALAPEPLKG
jgi:formylglycine-generating enzyme required for sulfatase activity